MLPAWAPAWLGQQQSSELPYVPSLSPSLSTELGAESNVLLQTLLSLGNGMKTRGLMEESPPSFLSAHPALEERGDTGPIQWLQESPRILGQLGLQPDYRHRS